MPSRFTEAPTALTIVIISYFPVYAAARAVSFQRRVVLCGQNRSKGSLQARSPTQQDPRDIGLSGKNTFPSSIASNPVE